MFRLPWLCLAFLAACVFLSVAEGAQQEFRLDRPEAQSVGLVGEFNDWKSQPMTRGPDGIWSVTTPLAGGTYGYKFLVNGSEWLFDPARPERKTVNNIENSAITVTEENSLGELVSPTPAFSSTAAPNLPVSPGQVGEFEVPLSPRQRVAAAKSGNPQIKTARIALGVPADFDPQKSWPILIISGTLDASSIELLGAYREAALAAGWVILAADGPVKPKDDITERRIALVEAGLDYLSEKWPAAKTWPVACGGFSGGAKRSGYVGAALLKDQRKLIGLLMGGCNEDTASNAAKTMSPPYAYKLVPIYLSGGSKDTIASPEMIEWVERSMKSDGFRHVRFESYDGAHDVFPPHTTEALQWFLTSASASANGTPAPKSNFDRFFKKP